MSTLLAIGETISQQFTPTTLVVSGVALILFFALYIFSVKREKIVSVHIRIADRLQDFLILPIKL